MLRQKSLFSKLVTGITLGMVNPGDDGVILKDPFTGIGNYLAHAKDTILHNLNQGVWIGKRIITDYPLGFSSYATEVLNVNVLHYAFMVDGKAYHLTGSKGRSLGSGTSVKIQQLREDKGKYEWFYKGKLNRSLQQVQRLIQKINTRSLRYNIAQSNCIDVSKAFVGFARGILSQEKVQKFIQTGLLRGGTQLIQEGINLIKS